MENGALADEAHPLSSVPIHRMLTDGVAEAPGGAHFTANPPDYGRDEAFQKEYAAAAADPAEWEAFANRYVLVDDDEYRAHVAERQARERHGDPGVTRAESCVVACADAWREAGEVMASPFGTIPALGARLAKLTFAPDLVLTDGEAALMVGAPPIATPPADLVREAAMPYRSVFDVVWSGRRHIMMMASQIDRTGNQNISAIGPHDRPKVQLVGVRGAPGQLGQPPHQLLGARPHRAHLRGAGRRRQRRGLRPRRRGRAGGHALPRHPPRRVEPRRVRLRDAGAHHAPALAPPRRDRRRHRGRHRLRAHRPRRRGRDPPAHARGARRSSASCSTPARCATARCGADRRRRPPDRRRCTRRSTPSCANGSACATRWCRPAWGGWPGPRLVAATTEAGGLGILASATMSLDELAAPSPRCAAGPRAPSASTCAPTWPTSTSASS